MVEQLDDTFEVVVVDDGSNDGSLDILRNLESEYKSLRVEPLDYSSDRYLADTRNISFKKSKGDYILESLDTDDRYSEGIMDFVTIYHQIEDQVDFDFYLKGDNINMASRELLLEFPYRHIGRGQDRDLWRRLFANDSLIWLEHESFCEPIGYEPSRWEEYKISYEIRRNDLRSGVSFRSYLRWLWENGSLKGATLHSLIGLVAYIQARRKGIYELPSSFTTKGALDEAIAEHSMTLREVEEAYDINIDRSELSKAGRRIFFDEH